MPFVELKAVCAALSNTVGFFFIFVCVANGMSCRDVKRRHRGEVLFSCWERDQLLCVDS